VRDERVTGLNSSVWPLTHRGRSQCCDMPAEILPAEPDRALRVFRFHLNFSKPFSPFSGKNELPPIVPSAAT
jgi:hypothetical protein